MKKIVLIGLVLIMALSLAACGGGVSDKYVGEWKAYDVRMGDLSSLEMTGTSMNLNMTLNDDGTGSFSGDSVGEFAWEETETGIFVDDGQTEIDVPEVEDGMLSMESEGVEIIFERV